MTILDVAMVNETSESVQRLSMLQGQNSFTLIIVVYFFSSSIAITNAWQGESQCHTYIYVFIFHTFHRRGFFPFVVESRLRIYLFWSSVLSFIFSPLRQFSSPSTMKNHSAVRKMICILNIMSINDC